MTGYLEIENILCVPTYPRISARWNCNGASRTFEKWYEVRIWIVNQSENTTFYVIKDLQAIKCDADASIVTLSLCVTEHRDFHGHVLMHRLEFEPIIPGLERVICVTIPQHIRQISIGEPAEVKMDECDLLDFDRLTCEVDYHRSPFVPKRRESPEQLLQRLAAWGETVEMTTPIDHLG